jgi:hypothetical protein
MGEEPEVVDQRTAAGQKRATDLGLKFDVGRSGVSSVAIAEGAPQDISAPEPNAPPDGSAPPAPQASVQLNIPTPWPNGEVIEIAGRDALGRATGWRRRPAAVGE